MSKKNDLKFAQRFAMAHVDAVLAYRKELRRRMGDEDFATLDQMATNAKMGLYEFVKARAIKLLGDCRRASSPRGNKKR